MTDKDAAERIRRLEEALRIAMQYMPHGSKYEGPLTLRPEDAADFEMCNAALKGFPAAQLSREG